MKKRSKERLEKWSEKMVILLGIALWWIILSVVVCIVSILENGGFNKSAKEEAKYDETSSSEKQRQADLCIKHRGSTRNHF